MPRDAVTSNTPEPRPAEARIVGGIIACLYVFYIAFPNAIPDFSRFNADDSGFYVGLADSLARDHGYTLYQPPIYVPHQIWPPAWPFFLSLLIRIFGANYLALKIGAITLAMAGLVILYRYLRRVQCTPWAATIVIATGLSPIYFALSHQLLADVPLAVASIFALGRLQRWMDGGLRLWKLDFWLAAAGVALAYLVKLHGLALLAAAPVAFVLSRKAEKSPRVFARCAVFVAVAGLPFAALFARATQLEREGIHQPPQIFYGNETGEVQRTSLLQIRDLFQADGVVQHLKPALDKVRWGLIYEIPEFALPILTLTGWRSSSVPWGLGPILAILVSIPVLVGWFRRLRGGDTLTPSYFVIHIVMVLWAPCVLSPRYLVPLLPLDILYYLEGVTWILGSHARKLRLAVVLPLLSLPPFAAEVVHQVRSPYFHEGWAQFVETATWLREHAPGDSAVLTHNWAEFHLVSGLATYPSVSPPGGQIEQWSIVAARPVIYLLEPIREQIDLPNWEIKLQSRWYAWLDANPGLHELTHANPYFRVHRLLQLPLELVLRPTAAPVRAKDAR